MSHLLCRRIVRIFAVTSIKTSPKVHKRSPQTSPGVSKNPFVLWVTKFQSEMTSPNFACSSGRGNEKGILRVCKFNRNSISFHVSIYSYC